MVVQFQYSSDEEAGGDQLEMFEGPVPKGVVCIKDTQFELVMTKCPGPSPPHLSFEPPNFFPPWERSLTGWHARLTGACSLDSL